MVLKETVVWDREAHLAVNTAVGDYIKIYILDLDFGLH